MPNDGFTLLNANEVLKLFRTYPDQVGKGVQRTFVQHGNSFLATYTKKRLSGHGPASVGVRTGQLRQTAASRPFGTPTRLGSLGVAFSLGTPYAPVHERGTQGAGGTLPDIQPRNVQWLTIPVGNALTASGAAPLGARDVPDLHFIPRDAETALLAKSDGGELDVWFILKKRVAIPPRLHLREDWDGAVPKFMLRLSKILEPLFRKTALRG